MENQAEAADETRRIIFSRKNKNYTKLMFYVVNVKESGFGAGRRRRTGALARLIFEPSEAHSLPRPRVWARMVSCRSPVAAPLEQRA